MLENIYNKEISIYLKKHYICVMLIFALILFVIFKIEYSLKADTLLLVFGNFSIAYWISTKINKKHKNEELIVNNCFEELNSFMTLITDLRKTIKDKEFDDDYSKRAMSLFNLQIDLIGKYNFIKEEHKSKLIQLEKKILVIKSEILQSS